MVKLTSLDATKEITFDNKSYVLNEKDLGTAAITLSTYKGNNQIGVKVSGRTLDTRDISIVGYILAEDKEEMLQKKRNLQKLVNPFEDFYLVIDKYRIQVSASQSIEYAIAHYENNKWLCKFLIAGTCGNPCFTEINPVIVPVAYWQANFHFPLTMTEGNTVVMGVRQPAMIKMIDNVGETEIGMQIRFRANVNDITNPYIMNLLTQEKLQLNCTMSAGEVIEVNTNYGEKSVIQNGSTDYFYTMDLDSDFLQLHQGENYLRYGADTNEENLEIDIEYRPQYLEV